MPKFNMYQSLHTTVIGPEGKPVEIQIRTHTMHRRAEYGVAAHWKYKERHQERARRSRPSEGGGEMVWLRQLVDWQRETEDPSEFLDSLRFEMNVGEVYVFTPKGEVVSLPAGSTPVDFAYAVHTEVGHRTIGGRVNGRLVPLESTLENGDVVEVLTSKADGAGPSPRLAAVRQERRGRATRSGSGSPRSGARRPSSAARIRSPRRCASRSLPLQRLMSAESLAGDRRRAALRRHRRPVRGGGGGPRLRGPRREPGRRRRSAARRAPARTSPRPRSRRRTRPRRGRRPRSRRRRRRRRAGQAGQVLHPGSRATRSSASSPAATGSRCTARTARTPSPCCAQNGPAHRRRVGAERVERVPRAAPGRGAGPQPAALRRHPGPVRPARQHPVGVACRPRATGWPCPGSRSRWATRRTSTTCISAVRRIDGVFDVYRITGGRTQHAPV